MARVAGIHGGILGEGVVRDDLGDSAALCWRTDVTDLASVQSAVASGIDRFGRLDVLVNNAGIGLVGSVQETEATDWSKLIAVNMTGVFLTARTAARHMIAAGAGGSIVTMSSIMGLSGGGLYPNISYQTSNGAVVNMTRALAIEWARHDIRVNAVAPTYVRTRLIAPLLESAELTARILAMTPLGRLAEPEDVAAAIAFLASPAAGMITGCVLPVDGGFLAQ